MDKRIVSVLALLGLNATTAVVGGVQSPLQIIKREPNRLTLQFRGAKPAMVEVVVEGVVIASRYLTPRTTQLQLDLLGTGLAPGSHTAVIKLYDAQGRLMSQSTTRIELLPDPNSPLTIWMPRNGAQVSGITPIEVRVNNPNPVYVSFFIDGQVRGLRNYPPYIYQWDTTREQNGWHTIEVWGYDGNQTLRTPPLRVYVNNPGGRTERQSTSKPAEVAPPETMPAETVPTALGEQRESHPEARLSDSARASVPPMPEASPAVKEASPWHGDSAPAGALTLPKQGYSFRGTALQRREPPRLSAPRSEALVADAPSEAPLSTAVQPTLPSSAPNLPMRLPPTPPQPSALTPRNANAPQEPETVPTGANPTFGTQTMRLAQAEPHMRGQKLRMPQVAFAEPATPTPTRWLSIEYGTRLPAGTSQFEVVLDATVLSFDVAPQVENDIPLVPIRRVLEQLGAQVHWDNREKVASAQLGTHSLMLRVRENQILVDGTPVPTEVPLRIVRGRTLVPASALRQLLNAEVAYDPATAQLIISTGR
ncbi:MAG: stalk domain-containing protein [Fimbriimonadales bacterium]|nr:stalk domain-containing protein [Fimbriimonadales bacterium]MDW8051157.1 stalk domain-containing protein [Armatimonadota bacterium]